MGSLSAWREGGVAVGGERDSLGGVGMGVCKEGFSSMPARKSRENFKRGVF